MTGLNAELRKSKRNRVLFCFILLTYFIANSCFLILLLNSVRHLEEFKYLEHVIFVVP